MLLITSDLPLSTRRARPRVYAGLGSSNIRWGSRRLAAGKGIRPWCCAVVDRKGL